VKPFSPLESLHCSLADYTMDDEELRSTIRAFGASISKRVPVMEKICGDYRRAEYQRERVYEHRAFVEKRLWDRFLYTIGVRVKNGTSEHNKCSWPAFAFLVLENRALQLESQWTEANNVSPRLSLAIAEALCDCDLFVRYFDYRLGRIRDNDSADEREGVTARKEINRIFPALRDLLTHYRYELIPL
jgi:hypothetical protein